MGSGDVPPDLELETGRLYSLDGARNLEEKFGPVTISNGLAWTADNSIMYYIDSIPRQIYTFDFDLEMGTIGWYFTFVSLPLTSEKLSELKCIPKLVLLFICMLWLIQYSHTRFCLSPESETTFL